MTRLFLPLLALPFAMVSARADDPKFEYKSVPDAPPPDATPPGGPPAMPPLPVNIWKANLQLGFSWVAGNAESLGITGSGLVGWKRYNNQLELFVQGAYARAGTTSVKGGPVDGHDTVAASWLWRLRYDRYFLEKNTVFASYQMNGDLIAGILYRVEPQVGFARIFFLSPHQQFRGELGYDYSFEHYLAGSVPLTANFHSGRLFFYYENKFTPYASFSEGLELLEAFNKLDRFRLNSLTSLSSTLSKRVALKINYTIRFNNDPPLRPAPNVGQFGKWDSLLDAVLAVTFL
jgi:putative salt-induced outer membrane protein YdiY